MCNCCAYSEASFVICHRFRGCQMMAAGPWAVGSRHVTFYVRRSRISELLAEAEGFSASVESATSAQKPKNIII